MTVHLPCTIATLLLIGGPLTVRAQHLCGEGATFAESPARHEVAGDLTFIDVDPACEIIMHIGVDRKGKVVSSEVEEGTGSCTDPIVLGKVLRSVRARVFNASPESPKVQYGKVHWSYHQLETDMMDVVAMPDEVEDDDQVYERTKVEQAPSFPGGEAALDRYMLISLRYPEDAMTAKKEGTVLLSFIVEKDGKLSTFTLEKGVEANLNQEAMRVMLRMPNWNPGLQNGRQVRTRCELPITFRIQ